MKNNLLIDNPLKIRPPAAAKQSALSIHAGKGGFQAAIADAHSHRSLLDAADDALPYHLQRAVSSKDFRRLMESSLVTALPAR